MTRRERLVLLAYFAGVVALLVRAAPTSAVIGAVVGVSCGLVVAARLNRLRTRMDARLGPDRPVTGFRPRRLVVRVAAHHVVVGVLLVSTVLIPFIGDQLFAGLAAAATGLPFVVTAGRLRRPR